MAALAQLLASHECILVIDAASGAVQVGLLQRGAPPRWERSPEEAGRAIFSCAGTCLRQAGRSLRDVQAFVFCEGPGSMLGIRTAAMVLRTWQTETPRPAYRYQSLPLLALGLRQGGAAAPLAVVADARRDAWFFALVSPDGPAVPPLQRLSAAELAVTDVPLYQPAAFRAWARPPRPAQDCGYDVDALFTALPDRDLFHPAPSPEPLQFEAPDYRKWSPRIHRAATASDP